MLHILNGDSSASLLEQSGLAGERLPWREALVEGPTPRGLSADAWRAVRASHLADAYGIDASECARDLARQEAALRGFDRHEEVVLWFEHDLFCQANLLYLLDWFGSRTRGGTKLSLICIDAFPGIEDFRGLGQLTPGQMASLFDTRREVSDREMELAARAWAAYCSPDPRALTDLLSEDTSALPFLAGALRGHLVRFPSVENGLGRVEGRALELVARGARDFATLFGEFGRAEPAYGFGDFQFWLALERLANGRDPVLTIEGAHPPDEALASGDLMRVSCDVTAAGRAVLAGEADFVERNGIDAWLGGVHLRDGGPIWRWDGAALQRAG